MFKGIIVAVAPVIMLALKFPEDYLKILLVFIALDGVITLVYLIRKGNKRRRAKASPRGDGKKSDKGLAGEGDSDESGFDLHVDDTYEMTGSQFEDFVAELYERLGYKIISSKKSRDQGIDLIVRRVFKVGIQCKCYHRPVGNKAVQETAAGKKFYRLRRAVVVTNNIFTASAAELAKKTGVKLIDCHALAVMIRKAR